MKYRLGSVTRIGNRKENEDSYGSFSNGHALVMVVADGMGGHRGGKLASEVLVKSISKCFEKESGRVADPVAFIRSTLLHAHDEVNRHGASQNPPLEPRTTVVICLVQNGQAWWAHMGDSRLYMFRHGELIFRSRDHSRIEELMQQGLITSKQALNHPQRNQVTRCIGGPDPITSITISKEVPLQMGDRILLCTDGLWNALRSKRISELVSGQHMDDISSNLASEAEALSMPHSDNITVILMHWLSPYAEPLPPSPQNEEAELTKTDELGEETDEITGALDTLKAIFSEYEKELK